MPSLRFNHVFAALLALSALCAFVVPARISDRVRGGVQFLFSPVAYPVNRISTWLLARHDSPNDPRGNEELARENQQLRIEVANLSGQIQKLTEREADRQRIAGGLCGPFAT